MPDYKNGKIYKLVSDNSNLIYIGSTTQNLNVRLWKHNEIKNKCSSKNIYELGGNISIELIKLFPCYCKKELEKEEGKYIRQYKNICVNKLIAGRTRKEHYDEFKKELYNKSKEYQKKYRKDNYQDLIFYKKSWNIINKEKLNKQSKKYREDNKEKLSEKYKCVCGSEVYKRSKKRHENTNKHIHFLEQV